MTHDFDFTPAHHASASHSAHDLGMPLAIGLYAAWDLARALSVLEAGLPPWPLVPPLMLGAAAVLNARANLIRARGTAKP